MKALFIEGSCGVEISRWIIFNIWFLWKSLTCPSEEYFIEKVEAEGSVFSDFFQNNNLDM